MNTTADPVTVWTTRPSWFDEALCRGAGHHLFFPDQGDMHGARDARAICARCPVRSECLAHAMTFEEHFGIWGGTNERDRRRLRGWSL